MGRFSELIANYYRSKSMRQTPWLILLMLFLLGTGGDRFAAAAPVAVVNAGFEDISGESPTNEFTFGPLSGWDLYDPEGITSGGAGATFFIGTLTPFEPDPIGSPGVYSFFDDGAAEGGRVGIAFNFFGSGDQGEYGMVQTLSETLEAYTIYTLEVDVGNIASGTSMGGGFFNLDGLPGYRVDLLAGGELIDQDNNLLFGSIADGQFGMSSFSFSTGAAHAQLGQALGIRLVNLNEVDPSAPNADLEVDFDNVRFSAVPAVAGDYNFNGTVDAADYTVWRDAFESGSGGLDADGNDDGTIDLVDHAFWASRFGDTVVSGVTVPEPSTVVLLFGAIVGLASRYAAR